MCAVRKAILLRRDRYLRAVIHPGGREPAFGPNAIRCPAKNGRILIVEPCEHRLKLRVGGTAWVCG